MEADKALMTLVEFASATGYAEETLRKYAEKGAIDTLPPWNVKGVQHLFKREDIDRWKKK